ncbi:peptidyl-prolyl cis-trans isomerase [Chitinilyticum piscinae]|uniref:Periplasmic chaperone PpiD n=1 Tax=Chitinilyticum piscinae TaxID=2866724 RepID=A0A8J7G1J0_9NEIS|nr:peptidyl-prolyl cis-trans isomerase [Chitinilyticum piscinae]MBE9609683.1 peptidyl-prolyl cis-trans isomerase [Chitinilyticum piscinae]
MFDYVQNHKTAAQVLLGAVSLGLIVTAGVTGYGAMSDNEGYLAKVAGSKITPYDFAVATQGQPVPDAEKAQIVEQLIQQRLLTVEAKEQGLAISQSDLAGLIAKGLAMSSGKPSPTTEEIQVLYKQQLEARRMTADQYDESVRKDVLINQLLQPIFASGFVSNASLDLLNRILGETREVSVVTLPGQDYLAKATVSDDEISKYYGANQAKFKSPEMVRIDYVTLSAQKFAEAASVNEADVAKYFEEHRSELAKEERKIRLIQLNYPANASADAKAAVRKDAEAVLAQLKKNPADFANVAKQKSQDALSAANGGDLGYLAKGVSQNADFDAAAFKLAKGQVSDLVEGPQGLSILLVEDIKARQLADVRPEIEGRLKNQAAQEQVQKKIEELNEFLYQEGGSLKPAADKFQLTVLSSNWLTRKGAQDQQLNNPKLIEAVFADDVLKNKQNTSAIEVAPGMFIAARVLEHKPEQQHKLDEVKPVIEQMLKQDKAVALAKQDGEAKLKQLQSGSAMALTWGESKPVRQDLNGQAGGPVKEIFKVDAGKLPAYVGAEVPGQGYLLVRVNKVTPAAELNAQTRQQFAAMLQRQLANREAFAYLDALKTRYEVKVPVAKAAKAE